MKYEAKDFDNDFLMGEIDISSMGDSSSVSELTDTDSQINKSELLSSTVDLEKSDVIENYEWLQPQDSSPSLSRSDRKTVYNRRTPKASEEEVTQTFK